VTAEDDPGSGKSYNIGFLQFTEGGAAHLVEMFCVKCRKKVTVDDGAVKKEMTTRGRPILKAICPVCGTKMTKFTK